MIKTFESFKQEDYYIELVAHEFRTFISDVDLKDFFNDDEFKWITDTFNREDWGLTWYPGTWQNIRGLGNIQVYTVNIERKKKMDTISRSYVKRFSVTGKEIKETNLVTIYKLRDEWYLVTIVTSWDDILYFKCDGWEGLLELVKNKVVI